jgi:hypothetical protein
LETFEIIFECMNYNDFSSNDLIGSFSIGLGTLYRNSGHEIFNKWLPLSHPDLGAEIQVNLLFSNFQ